MSKKIVSTETPQAPAELSPEARWLWEKKIKQLANLGLLHTVNLEVLARYCTLVIRYWNLSRQKNLRPADRQTLLVLSQTIFGLMDQLGLPLDTQMMLARMRQAR